MTLVSTAAVLMTGAGYYVAHGALGGITVSQALSPDDPRSSGDDMNILLIGLDSRKDQDGNDLPNSILKQLHAGDSDDGGYNTNTLILVHVGPTTKSSPSRSPATTGCVQRRPRIQPHQDQRGIRAHQAVRRAETRQPGRKQPERTGDEGREAGRAATLRAVRSLTGVPIDYFAEINLAGFYDLAQSLGGVNVCLNHAVYDSYSGADFPAGPQKAGCLGGAGVCPATSRPGKR